MPGSVSTRSGWRFAFCFTRVHASARLRLPQRATTLDPSPMTPPWRSPLPEPPQQARSSRGQNGTVRVCACPHLKPAPVLVRERGQAPALTLHPVPSRWSLSSTFAACPERSSGDTSPLLRLYKATPPPLLATHHSTPPPRTRRRAEARSGRRLAVAPTRGLRRSPQASCRSPGPLELKQLLGQGLSGLLELPGPRQALGAASSHRLPPLRRTPSATEAWRKVDGAGRSRARKLRWRTVFAG